MSNELPFDRLGMNESPPTIAYVMLSLTTAAFNTEIAIEEDYEGEVIVLRDRDSGFEYFRVRVSSMMGVLLVAVLNQTADEIGALTVGNEPWISNHS
jgi:hypothetical protein